MIAFGVCVGDQDTFLRVAAPSIARVAEPDSPLADSTDNASIFTAYNEMLDVFAGHDDLEALVLLHEDVEIRDPHFLATVREALSDPDVAVVGVVGARGVRSLAWWEGDPRGRCEETRGLVDFGGGSHDVDVVDGLLLVLSPWAVRSLRFDEARFSGFHGYDADLCLQARCAGKRVRVVDLDVRHHTKGGFGDVASYQRSDAAFTAKWAGFLAALGSPAAPVPAAALSTPAVEPLRCLVCACPMEVAASSATHSVVACASCGLGATLPPPRREASSDGIWEQQYGGQRLAMRPQWLHEAAVRLSWVQLHAPDGALLEIGSGTGEFVATAVSQGYEAYGLEPSAWAAEQARELGADVTTGTLEQWQATHAGQVDAIVSWHVLEHVHEPRELLSRMRDVLRPGGLLLLEVPNYASAAAPLDTFAWIGSALEDHVHHFTPASLTALLEQEGFGVEVCLEHTARVYASAAGWPAEQVRWAAAGLPEVPQDLLRVVARLRGGAVPTQREHRESVSV
jgi:2-polyprenyl-3-methyl-5-hydroxy-6-metoxy-1,4-benzoquinol methylase